ncbi:MAG: alpha-amylase family glycosyl hydrolase [Gaiellaceae bacterium]
MPEWWRDAVVYQIYPLSFQDSDRDGLGDLPGITMRLGHVRKLGADAIWLSPIYPSPLFDNGYDVSDYEGIHPRFGTLDDLDRLVEEAHRHGLRLLLDLVPCHTSIEHPWFREHPDWYVWVDDGPANNWISAFGGPAWSRDERSGRWYLHSFYAEQPDLDWRNPEVVSAMSDVIRFWLDRGIDGFRVDAIDRIWKDEALRDDPPGFQEMPLPVRAEEMGRLRVHSRGAEGIEQPLAAIRRAAGDALLVGELYMPTSETPRYLEFFDLGFAFELLFADWADVARLGRILEQAAALERLAWVLSNHDFDRMATRLGPRLVPAASVVLLTLRGSAFVYQGDEIGMVNGAPTGSPRDRRGRDGSRHPMQWDASPGGGFSDGEPYLPPVDPAVRNVADQERDPRSLLSLYRRLIALRRELGPGFDLLRADDEVLSFRRGDHVVSANLGVRPVAVPARGRIVLSTAQDPGGRALAPGEARIEEID